MDKNKQSMLDNLDVLLSFPNVEDRDWQGPLDLLSEEIKPEVKTQET